MIPAKLQYTRLLYKSLARPRRHVIGCRRSSATIKHVRWRHQPVPAAPPLLPAERELSKRVSSQQPECTC